MVNLRVRQWRFRTQLLSVMILLVAVPVVTLGTVLYESTRQHTMAQVEQDLQHHTQTLIEQVRIVHQLALEKLDADLATAQYILAEGGTLALDDQNRRSLSITNQINQQTITVDIPMLTIGERPLWESHELVDRMKSSSQLTATIFQYLPEGLLRVSTNVLNQDQSRAIGTFIPPDSPVYQAIAQGQSYRGRAFVVNDWYLSVYEPIRGPNNSILGALYVGLPERYYQDVITESLDKIVVGETGYVFILNPAGDYVLSDDRQRDGENILQSQDEEGHYFIQDMVAQAQQLAEQDTRLMYYPWRNADEAFPRLKIAAYGYFPDWEWIVASSAYHEEFLRSLQTLRAWTVGICLVFLLIALLIAYSFSGFLGQAMTLVVKTLDQVATGQLQYHPKSYATNRELNHMFLALGRMQQQLRDMVSQIAQVAHSMSATSQELGANVQTVTFTVDQVVTNIAEITQDAQQTHQLAQQGEQAARHAEKGMQAIRQSLGASSQAIGNLDHKTATIDQMATLIHDISQQTNLLALNAAIEATRAGDSGQGFAVVAKEIRRLSDEVKGGTTEIQQSVADLMQAIKHTSTVVQAGHGEVGLHRQGIDEALTALNAISHQADHIALAVADLKRTEQISRSMGEVNAVVANLSGMAQELQGLVSQFHW